MPAISSAVPGLLMAVGLLKPSSGLTSCAFCNSGVRIEPGATTESLYQTLTISCADNRCRGLLTSIDSNIPAADFFCGCPCQTDDSVLAGNVCSASSKACDTSQLAFPYTWRFLVAETT